MSTRASISGLQLPSKQWKEKVSGEEMEVEMPVLLLRSSD